MGSRVATPGCPVGFGEMLHGVRLIPGCGIGTSGEIGAVDVSGPKVDRASPAMWNGRLARIVVLVGQAVKFLLANPVGIGEMPVGIFVVIETQSDFSNHEASPSESSRLVMNGG